VASYLEWGRHQRALRRGEPMGTSMLPRILAIAITILAVAAAALSLLAPATGG
jgi:putative membrane protein